MYSEFAGVTVILTREAGDNTGLAARLRPWAADVVELPCVRIDPLDDPRSLREALAALRDEDWLVVTSRHGADAVARCGPTRAAVAAIGDATTERLREHGLRVAFRPSAPSGTALARELPRRPGVVVLARSDRALPDLPRILRERGLSVRDVVAYRTIAEARGDIARVRELLSSPQSVAVFFHSPSAVEGLLRVIEPQLLVRASIHVLGRSTLRAVRDAVGIDAAISPIEEREAAHVPHR